MLLITGATGHLGAATVDFLLKKVPANQLAVLARDENKAADLKAKGVEVRAGDYHDYASLVKAFSGVEKLLLISSSDMNDRKQQQINAINAAKEAGVRHVIYTSVAMKDIDSSVIQFVMQSHFDTAAYLKASGLTYTLLNHNLYMDVLPMFVGEKVLETGIFLPAGEGRVPFALRRDMAEAAANVLTTEGHENKEYTISSDVLYSMNDLSAELSELAGRTIPYINPSKEVFVEQLAKAGLPQELIGFTAGFAEAISRNEFDVKSNDLENLLGRKPTSLKAFLSETYFS